MYKKKYINSRWYDSLIKQLCPRFVQLRLDFFNVEKEKIEFINKLHPHEGLLTITVPGQRQNLITFASDIFEGIVLFNKYIFINFV